MADVDDGMQPKKPAARCRLVSVEPVIFLILAVQGILVNLRTVYVEARRARDYNYTLPDAGNCSSTNISGDPIGKKIDAETSIWVMYMKSTSVFIPIFTGTILIAASDFVGRKPILILNAFGHLIASTIFLLLAWLSLPLIVAVAAEVVLGITGDSIVSINVAIAYTGDTRVGRTRTVRMVLLSFLIYAGFGSSQILVDILLERTGNYDVAFGIAVGAALLNFLYVCAPGLLLETVQRRPGFSVGRTFGDLLRGFWRLLAISSERRRARILLLVSIFMVYTMIVEAIFSVVTIYGLAQPFCWSATLVGIYNVIVNTWPALVALVAIRPLLVCMSNYWIIEFGFLSGMALQIVTATAKSNTMLVYVAVAVGSFRSVPDGVIFDMLSKMVSSQEQGIAFSLLSITSSVGKVISPFLFNAVYARTVLIGEPQLTFYVAAAIYVVPMALTLILQICSRPYEGKSLEIQAKEEEEHLVKDE